MKTRAFVILFSAWVGLVPAAWSIGVVDSKTIDKAFGIQLWQGDSLWADNEKDVAKRLSWPEESRTSTLASYRLYPKKDMEVLGTHPHSLALYAEKGHVTQVSMVFANRGDMAGVSEMKRDAQTIEATLKSALGEPETKHFGLSAKLRYKVLRWNWKGHAILLETPEAYVGVRIVAADLADKEGMVGVINLQQLRETLLQRVKKRDNGDIVVGEIPMVDQGPKGYCVPATWERYLRYLGIQVDMYVLAMFGQTKAGGGTSAELMAESVSGLARRTGRHIDEMTMPLTLTNLTKYVDKGFPLMWCVFIDLDLEKKIDQRTAERKKVTDWSSWTEKLKPFRSVAKVGMKTIKGPETGNQETTNGHMRMVIGYNPKTREVAISDSWGKRCEERWTTLEEAQAMSQGDRFWDVK